MLDVSSCLFPALERFTLFVVVVIFFFDFDADEDEFLNFTYDKIINLFLIINEIKIKIIIK